MHLTLYTDYTLRLMMYLAVRHADGGTATIDEIAAAYAIPRSNLMKIVNELAQHGLIETTRGRSGGTRLARPPGQISVGALVRLAEKEFAIVACHATPMRVSCAIMPTCNLKNGLRRAVDAFLYELDKMTLADAIIAPGMAAALLRIPPQGKEVAVPVANLLARQGKSRTSGARASRAARPRPRRTARPH